MQYFRTIRGALRPLVVVVVLALGAGGVLYVMRPEHPAVLNPVKPSEELAEKNRIDARRAEVRKTVDRWVKYHNEVKALVRTLERSIQTLSTEGSTKGAWELPYLQTRAATYRHYSEVLGGWIARAETTARLKACDEALARGELGAANAAVSQAVELAAAESLVSEKLRHEHVSLLLIDDLLQTFSGLSLETRVDKALPASPRSEVSLQVEGRCQQFSKDEPKATAELVSRLKSELGDVEDPHHVSEAGDWERKVQPLQWLTAGRDPDVGRWAPYFNATVTFESEPVGANVQTLEGTPLGVTPLVLTVPGRVADRVRIFDNVHFEQLVVVEAKPGAPQTLKLELERVPPLTPGKKWRHPELGFELVWLPPGTFEMGSPPDEPGRAGDEVLHTVTLTEGYWFGATEVTQATWEAVMGNNPSNYKHPLRPVEQVTWDEAMSFCEKLTAREKAAGRLPEGYVYTLPTEEQWEYAAKRGEPAPAETINDRAWFVSNSGGTSNIVGLKQASLLGLYDILGNVSEWVSDHYTSYSPNPRSISESLQEPNFCIQRGGSWAFSELYCRTSHRFRRESSSRSSSGGFRISLSKL